MPDVWCKKCQDRPPQPDRKLCKFCEKQAGDRSLAIGCMSVWFGLGAVMGFIIRGCM